ncbi:MAG: hypothetical protein QW270_03865 [Candidatus Bathyarchaeia archaeon]
MSLEKIEETMRNAQTIIKELNETVSLLLKKLDKTIEEAINQLKTEKARYEYLSKGFEPSVLLDFPDHLRKTMRAVLELGTGTAEQVSEKTGRSRSLESTYLNQLCTMGYLIRERRGQRVHYKVDFKKAEKVVGKWQK